MEFVDFVRVWAAAHAELLLTWLVAALVMMTLAWVELRRATRRAAMAMTEAVATTVAACVPDIAAAAQGAHPASTMPSGPSTALAQAMRALSLQSAERMQWLHAVANLRLPDTALPAVAPDSPVHPMVYDTPRPLAEAYLAVERRFADHARALLAERRAVQALETAERNGTGELHRIERETSVIVERFEQANAQSEQTDVQRFLIQKFNVLGNRERELTAQLRRAAATACRPRPGAVGPVAAGRGRLRGGPRSAAGRGTPRAWPRNRGGRHGIVAGQGTCRPRPFVSRLIATAR